MEQGNIGMLEYWVTEKYFSFLTLFHRFTIPFFQIDLLRFEDSFYHLAEGREAS
jgi:hypothetical protein